MCELVLILLVLVLLWVVLLWVVLLLLLLRLKVVRLMVVLLLFERPNLLLRQHIVRAIIGVCPSQGAQKRLLFYRQHLELGRLKITIGSCMVGGIDGRGERRFDELWRQPWHRELLIVMLLRHGHRGRGVEH